MQKHVDSAYNLKVFEALDITGILVLKFALDMF